MKIKGFRLVIMLLLFELQMVHPLGLNDEKCMWDERGVICYTIFLGL